MHICTVGLGNIGFNLYKFLLEKFPGEVTGVDVNKQIVQKLQELGYNVTSDYQTLTNIDTWLLAPSTGNQGQNLFAALDAMLIKPESLISIESTLPPGTMERIRGYLEERGFSLGLDLFVIHVPHRVMFGVDRTICDTPRVMGAFTKACLEKGRQFYEGLVPGLIEVLDVRIAELSKVVENVKRYVDIAFAEEIYRYCAKSGIDFQNLRLAVNSKENVELLTTDWGIGGECLPKDMGFLRAVLSSSLLDGAEQSDREYREEIIHRVGSRRRVLVKGLSYKPGVKDLKHSRAMDLVRLLQEHGTMVTVEDPLFTSEELVAEGLQPFVSDDETNELLDDISNEDLPVIVLERDRALEPK